MTVQSSTLAGQVDMNLDFDLTEEPAQSTRGVIFWRSASDILL